MNRECEADYKNWIPKGILVAMGAGVATLAAGAAPGRGTLSRTVSVVCGQDAKFFYRQ